MIPFIRYNLKQLFTIQHAFILIIYFAFAWFLSDPTSMSQVIYNSRSLTDQYDLILLSFVFMNFLLFVVANFKSELSKGKKDLLLTKLTAEKLILGFVISYSIYWAVGFALPSCLTALFQQWYYAAQCITLDVFAEKYFCSVVGYPFFLIACALLLFSVMKNEFLFLIASTLLYGCFHLASFVSHGMLFNYFWLDDIVLAGRTGFELSAILISLAVSFAIAIALIAALARKIRTVTFSEKLNNGMLVQITRALKTELSMYHYKMLGLSSSKVLYFFAFLGLLLVISLVKVNTGDFRPLVHLYIGAFLPCLFAFNQYNIIKIDLDADMLHNNFLRKMPYFRIILNRWLIVLIPQLAVISAYFLILSRFDASINFPFYVYTILLSLLFSLINLYSALIAKTAMTANLFLLFAIYIQLRDDVQSALSMNGMVTDVNIFYSFFNNTILPWHWIIVTGAIVLLSYASIRHLKGIKYGSVRN
jgi:hypothetical protein